jgi:membrane associated rhomboid family serine protease
MFPLRDSQRNRIFPIITYLIIAVNTVVFLVELTSPNSEIFIERYALIPAKIDFSNILSLTPLVSSQFLHAGFLHIISNMWFLKIFGDNIEERLGGMLFLILYLTSGVIGGPLQYFSFSSSTTPMLGASGAVAGILGAYLVFFPHHKIETLIPLGFYFTTVRISASFILIYWFAIQLFSGFGSVITAQIGGVAFWAHVGGFAFGWIVAKLLNRSAGKAEVGEIIHF